jgi:hypothetical protein
MKTKIVATALILICSLVMASSPVRADSDDWYQGRRGHWVQRHRGWTFRDSDGGEYRQAGNGWRWYNGRRHGAEGSEYHNRAPGDNRSYQQFQHDERH